MNDTQTKAWWATALQDPDKYSLAVQESLKEHGAVIQAWINGAEIEILDGEQWITLNTERRLFCADRRYRIKSEKWTRAWWAQRLEGHEHEEVIRAWINGAELEARVCGNWVPVDKGSCAFYTDRQYRVADPLAGLEKYSVDWWAKVLDLAGNVGLRSELDAMTLRARVERHGAVIKQWVEGAEVEARRPGEGWETYGRTKLGFYLGFEYRIKDPFAGLEAWSKEWWVKMLAEVDSECRLSDCVHREIIEAWLAGAGIEKLDGGRWVAVGDRVSFAMGDEYRLADPFAGLKPWTRRWWAKAIEMRATVPYRLWRDWDSGADRGYIGYKELIEAWLGGAEIEVRGVDEWHLVSGNSLPFFSNEEYRVRAPKRWTRDWWTKVLETDGGGEGVIARLAKHSTVIEKWINGARVEWYDVGRQMVVSGDQVRFDPDTRYWISDPFAGYKIWSKEWWAKVLETDAHSLGPRLQELVLARLAKHGTVIKNWVAGAEIEYRTGNGRWVAVDGDQVCFFLAVGYRIKGPVDGGKMWTKEWWARRLMERAHVHREVIEAWINGAEIECRGRGGEWCTAMPGAQVLAFSPSLEYRVLASMWTKEWWARTLVEKGHVHRKIIEAWINGAEIEYHGSEKWEWEAVDCDQVEFRSDWEYRVAKRWTKEWWARRLASGKVADHREVIEEWINGAEIEMLDNCNGQWHALDGAQVLAFEPGYSYRVKREPEKWTKEWWARRLDHCGEVADHREAIRAWINGAELEWLDRNGEWWPVGDYLVVQSGRRYRVRQEPDKWTRAWWSRRLVAGRGYAHQEIIEAWINGADIEYRESSERRWEVDGCDRTEFRPSWEYRVKPGSKEL